MGAERWLVEAWAGRSALRVGPALLALFAAVCVLFPAVTAAAPNETLVSSRSTGEGPPDGTGAAGQPGISDDGRFVVFSTTSPNHTVGDANPDFDVIPWSLDVFVRDHGAFPPTTTLVSRSSDGLPGNGESRTPSISANGRFVVFNSKATDLVPNDSNGSSDVFVYDREKETTAVVSRSSGAGPPDAGASENSPISISDDGRYVAFVGGGDNLAEGSGEGPNVFVRDRDPGVNGVFDEADAKTIWVSRPRGTELQQADGHSYAPSISGDGRYVAFESTATNLVDGRDSGGIFVRDLQANTTTFEANGFHPSLSKDGRFLAYHSPTPADVFVRDRRAGMTTLASQAAGGTPANGESFWAGISPDGRFVAFRSEASNLVAGDANAKADLFVRDLQEQTTRLESRSFIAVAPDADDESVTEEPGPVLSAGASFVAFDSAASNLVRGDLNRRRDVFRRELASPPPLTSLSVGDARIDEGDSGEVDVIFRVSLSEPSGQAVLVDYVTADISATQPDDYTPTSGTRTIPAGRGEITIAVEVKADTLDEPDEDFSLKLSNPRSATLDDDEGAGTIVDDDAASNPAGDAGNLPLAGDSLPPAAPSTPGREPPPTGSRPGAAEQCRVRYRGRRQTRRRAACLRQVALKQCRNTYRGRRQARRRTACRREVAVRHCRTDNPSKKNAKRRATCINRAKRRYR